MTPIRSLSLVFVTHNRAAALAHTLSHVAKCTIPEGVAVEIVAVDNASSDDTPAVIARFAEQAPASVVQVREARPGAGAARNAGVRQAKGEVIAMIDDDVIPHPQFLEQVRTEFERFPGPCVIGGRVELWDQSHAPFTIKTSLTDETLGVKDHPAGFVHGCNLCYRREVIDRIGGYDERFGPGTFLMAADDTDLTYRALRAGCPVRYSPNIVAYHNHGRTTDMQIERLVRGYFISSGAFFAKHILRGDRDMLRMAYWDILVSLRALRAPDRTPDQVRWHKRKLAHYAQGALRFLAVAPRSACTSRARG
jgi:GT2 family glycosyltransferase